MYRTLDTKIQFIKGVGPRLARSFEKKEIYTVADLLFYLPREYEDRRQFSHISNIKEGDFVYLKAKILDMHKNPYSRLFSIRVSDGTGVLLCKWFRFKDFYFKKYSLGDFVRLSGTVRSFKGSLELHHPDISLSNETDDDVGIVPIYSEIKGIGQKLLRRIIRTALESFEGVLEEFIPDDILHRYSLPSIRDSLKSLHFPPFRADIQGLRDAKSMWHRRLIFGEFFKLELLLMQRRKQIKLKSPIVYSISLSDIEDIRKTLPFTLTSDQNKVLLEIIHDMKNTIVMNRLIQGDVGSGKTIIAFFVAILAIKNAYQVVMMAPTEILAKQHYDNFINTFSSIGINIALLTGSTNPKRKQEIKTDLQEAKINFLIGTHAVIQKDVVFAKLGLVIVDEQHRFGVRERLRLLNHGTPDVLILTATPIPRSLAMTVYGDLDVSIIREKPKGRQKVLTRITTEEKRPQVYDFIKEKLSAGYQAYFVYPLIDETEQMQLKSAKQALEELSFVFTEFSLALLHGRMRQEEKDIVMREFKEGKTQILVSTTVIEVGIDVPNANIMLIENPERFGLSQLHQLRGRIGRGTEKAYCILILDKYISEQSYERLKIFEGTSDGFRIAEADLELRGPGEFLGTRQHGLPGFRFANIVRDMEILMLAKREAESLIAKDPNFNHEKNYKLRKYVFESKEAEFIRAV